ncbi:unnamed protein product [Bursaphelenchus okinawaensis]|uniref:Uncharacterized protein n=1 Tax=Bursaphelenchus okinawaensis TaxID=465554 RepID=A0A811JQX9_9BILA|nr:unnamed protein product [Bursaphelenchus okinawaensis]CAG9079332.1 unnamed protein product [Bursaphelenchus okinawaensis]
MIKDPSKEEFEMKERKHEQERFSLPNQNQVENHSFQLQNILTIPPEWITKTQVESEATELHDVNQIIEEVLLDKKIIEKVTPITTQVEEPTMNESLLVQDFKDVEKDVKIQIY